MHKNAFPRLKRLKQRQRIEIKGGCFFSVWQVVLRLCITSHLTWSLLHIEDLRMHHNITVTDCIFPIGYFAIKFVNNTVINYMWLFCKCTLGYFSFLFFKNYMNERIHNLNFFWLWNISLFPIRCIHLHHDIDQMICIIFKLTSSSQT